MNLDDKLHSSAQKNQSKLSMAEPYGEEMAPQESTALRMFAAVLAFLILLAATAVVLPLIARILWEIARWSWGLVD